MRKLLQISIFCVGIISLVGCRATKQLAADEKLLVKNSFEFCEHKEDDQLKKLEDDIEALVLQKPNKKAFGIWRIKLGFYTWANKKDKETKFRWWVKNKVGEPPSIYDDELRERTTNRIASFLDNHGYFYNQVNSKVKQRRKKVKIEYIIAPGIAYTIDSVYLSDSSNINPDFLAALPENSLLEQGNYFNTDQLQSERKRINDELKDFGYYKFSNEFVGFELDSSNADKSIDVNTIIKPFPGGNGKHFRYYINDIYVYTDHSLNRDSFIAFKDTIRLDSNFTFIAEEHKFDLKPLRESIRIEPNQPFNLTNHNETTSILANLGSFKFINIKYEELKGRRLNAHIYLTPHKKQSIAVSVQADSEFRQELGTEAGFTYQNKNLLKLSDRLVFSTTAGIEWQIGNDQNNSDGLINTADVGAEMNYYLSRLLLPRKLRLKTSALSPKTRFSIRYNFQSRINLFNINAYNAAIGYEWQKGRHRHIVEPVSANIFFISNLSPTFLERLEGDVRLANNYTERLIFGSNYTYVYGNKTSAQDPRFMSFRANIDFAGNFINNVADLFTSEKIEILDREVAEYSRAEFEIKHNIAAGPKAQFITRFNSGIGIAYGNSNSLPFIKQFYSGGANGLRAFPIRQVGPGGAITEMNNTFQIDQTGDFKLEANAEFRFDIIQFLKGAFFVDAGNIWLLKEDPNQPDGSFAFNRFYREIAVGAGIGIRLDFDFFVIRLDPAFIIRNPSVPRDDRWAFSDFEPLSRDWRRSNLEFNLAIGYPF